MVCRFLPFLLTLNDAYCRFQRHAAMLIFFKIWWIITTLICNCQFVDFTWSSIWKLFRHARSIIPIRLYDESKHLRSLYYHKSLKGQIPWQHVTFGYLIYWLDLVKNYARKQNERFFGKHRAIYTIRARTIALRVIYENLTTVPRGINSYQFQFVVVACNLWPRFGGRNIISAQVFRAVLKSKSVASISQSVWLAADSRWARVPIK